MIDTIENHIERTTHVRLPASNIVVCVIHMKNGHVSSGFSICDILDEFDGDVAEKTAYTHAISKLPSLKQYHSKAGSVETDDNFVDVCINTFTLEDRLRFLFQIPMRRLNESEKDLITKICSQLNNDHTRAGELSCGLYGEILAVFSDVLERWMAEALTYPIIAYKTPRGDSHGI